MRDDPLTPACVLQALELFAPQARPYNCDDHFDCWGLVQRVFDWFDEGYDVNEQLPDASTAGGRPGAGPEAAVATGCRVELSEAAADLWKHRPSREDHDEPLEWFDLPERLLHADSRFAVVVYARGAGGFSADAMTPFLYRPEDVRLSWRTRVPTSHQAEDQVLVFEGGCLDYGVPLVFEELLTGPAAAGSQCLVPAAGLRGGQDNYRYVTPWSVAGYPAFAPVEGVFAVARGG